MDYGPYTSGPVFYEDHSANLYYLNELYQNVAEEVSRNLSQGFGKELPITSGIWGGTYLIAEPDGKSKRRIWRFYCMVNLPLNLTLTFRRNLEKFVGLYTTTMIRAFEPHGLKLELKMWGGELPFSNKEMPNITMHLEDHSQTIRWLRPIISWNPVSWEQSIIYDSIRLVRELKQNLDYDKGPTLTDPQETKYMLQDVIITYLTLKEIFSEDFLEHAEPIIEELMGRFMRGLHEPEEIRELYEMTLNNALIYGFEEGLRAPYLERGFDILKFETWPIEKINWVPDEVKDKLIPPIKNIFKSFRQNLSTTGR